MSSDIEHKRREVGKETATGEREAGKPRRMPNPFGKGAGPKPQRPIHLGGIRAKEGPGFDPWRCFLTTTSLGSPGLGPGLLAVVRIPRKVVGPFGLEARSLKVDGLGSVQRCLNSLRREMSKRI